MKKMFINIPKASDEELEKMRNVLQTVFDSEFPKEEYLVLLSTKQFESINVSTDVFDKVRNEKTVSN